VGGNKTSQRGAGSPREADEVAPLDPLPLSAELESVLREVAERVVVLHGLSTAATTGDRVGDLDCAVAGLDPLWPLRLPPGWRLCQCFHYDINARTWVLERDGGTVWVDTMQDPYGLGRLSFPTQGVVAGAEPVRLAQPALRAAYLVAKRLHKRERDPEAWRAIGGLAREDPAAFLTSLRGAIGPRLAARVGASALEGQPPSADVWWRARRSLLAQRLRSPARLGEALELAARRALDRLTHPTGLVVLVAGPDGSGKTTLAAALSDLCEGMFVRQARFHWRPGVLPRPGAMLGRGARDARAPHARPAHGPLLSLLVTGYYWLDFVVGGWLRIAPVRLRGGLVVVERGWWDLAVDPHRYRLSMPPRVIRLLGAAVPRPDLALVLEADPETLRARKAELTEPELARQTVAWRRTLYRSVPRTFLDTSRGEAAVQAEARQTIVGHLERRAASRLASGWASLPSPRSGRWLLPRGSANVAVHGLNVFQPMNLRGRAAWEAARLVASVGGFRLLPRGPAPPRSVRDRLAPHLPPGGTFALARANHPGRFVALVLSHGGRASGIGKVATDPRGEEALEHEAAAIERVGPLLPAPIATPVLVAREPGLLLFEAERWHPRPRPWFLVPEVALALGRFFAAGSEDGGSTGPAHGDMAPWNLLHTDGRWVLIDWEYAFDDAPPLYDLFHFLLQSAGHLHRPRIDRILHDLRTGDGWIGMAAGAYVEGAGLTGSSMRDLFEEYLVVSRDRMLVQSPLPGADLELRERLLQRLGS
jgi:hypothetical protein